jgi:hypothetical protein
MTCQSLTFNHQTRLAVKVVIEDDTGMLAFSLLWSTRVFVLFWYVNRFVTSAQLELAELVRDISDLVNAIGMAANIYLNIADIVARSFAFGIGVRV